VPAGPDGPDPNDVAAEVHADIQRELARRLCSHIQHLIRARLANPLSSAIRLGPAGEHLVPVSAVTASFVEEQRGAVTSLTHFARGLGYTKLTGFLAGPHLKECLELVHDRVQNQVNPMPLPHTYLARAVSIAAHSRAPHLQAGQPCGRRLRLSGM
jgi:hypothetical protein